jgi:hypothetical protein
MKTAMCLVLLWMLPAVAASDRPANPAEDLHPRIPGWTLKVDPTVYTRTNLWDLIDGAADLFLLYGFETLHVGEYWRSDSLDVRVEIYDHLTSLNAFGMYSQERKPDYRFISIGTQGYAEEGVLNFLRGRYYVKCSTHMAGSAAQKDLETVARAVEAHLTGETSWPPLLHLLPSAGKIANSEVYIIQDFLGYSFFRSSYVAFYGKEPSPQLFVMPFDNAAEASRALEKYVGLLEKRPPTGKDGIVRLDDPNNGRVTLFASGKYVAGVLGCKEPKTEDRYISQLKALLSTER